VINPVQGIMSGIQGVAKVGVQRIHAQTISKAADNEFLKTLIGSDGTLQDKEAAVFMGYLAGQQGTAKLGVVTGRNAWDISTFTDFGNRFLQQG
jgi:hypothetical protein